MHRPAPDEGPAPDEEDLKVTKIIYSIDIYNSNTSVYAKLSDFVYNLIISTRGFRYFNIFGFQMFMFECSQCNKGKSTKSPFIFIKCPFLMLFKMFNLYEWQSSIACFPGVGQLYNFFNFLISSLNQAIHFCQLICANFMRKYHIVSPKRILSIYYASVIQKWHGF